MMREIGASLLLLAVLASGANGSFHETVAETGDREFALVMRGTTFNGLSWPSTPLLEAFLGERVAFTVIVPPLVAEPHTFHLHGHPWVVDGGAIVDTFLLRPGDVHRFLVPAGGVDEHAGDWMYHCHMDSHVAGGMWGVFRVYPYATRVGPVDAGEFTVTLDRLGEPVEGATLDVEANGRHVRSHVTELGGGRYRVETELADAPASLVVTATHATLGTSVARVGADGAALQATIPLDEAREAAHGHA